MSTEQSCDWQEWTRKNFPNATVSEQSLLSDKLSEIEKSVVSSADPQATLVRWEDAILAMRRSTAALSPQAGL